MNLKYLVGVVLQEGRPLLEVNFVVFYHPSESEIFGWSGLIRGVASIKGGNFVVFDHPSESEIFGWSGLIRGVASLGGQFCSILPSH